MPTIDPTSAKRARHIPVRNTQHVYYSTRADGSKVFEVRHPANERGTRLFQVVGPRLDAAKKRAREVHAETAIAPTSVATTFGDVVEQWRASRVMRARSAKRFDQVLRLHIEPRFSRVKIRDITTPMIGDWVGTLKRLDGKPGPLADGTKRLIIGVFSIVLRYAAEMGILAAPPKPPRQKWNRAAAGRRRIVTPQEEAALLAYCGPNPWMRPIIKVTLHQALRLGEVCALRWEDIDFGNGKLRIHQSTTQDSQTLLVPTKGGNDKTIMLTPTAREALLKLRMDADGGSNFVFHNRAGAPRSHRDIQRAFTAAARRADLKTTDDGKICFHSLRHTGISRLANHPSIPLVKVQEFARHANLQTTYGYIHPVDSEAINDAIAEALTAGAVT